MKHARSLVALCALFALVGQGCPQQTAVPPSAKKPSEHGAASKMAFGKLPSVQSAQLAATGASESASAPSGISDAPSVAAKNVAVGEGVSDSAIARPIPPPYPNTGIVTYELKAAMPDLKTEDDVLRYVSGSLAGANLGNLAAALGLPSQALGSNPNILNFNFSWKDADKLQWSYDASSRMASFWKEPVYRVMDEKAQAGDAQNPPKIDEKEFVRIADDFLTRKGFGNVQRGPGTVEYPWGDMPYAATDASVRCPMPMEGSSGAVSGGTAVLGTSAAKSATVAVPPTPANGVTTDVMPRCWWPMNQVTVVYDGIRNGKKIVDAGGYPWRSASVTIDLTDKGVTNGSVWLDRETESSPYPLLAKDVVEQRLKSGGRNPIYPWNGNATVKITSLELVWMRYDTWTDGVNETYLIPAIAGTGTAEYAADKRTETYRTILPLVADEAFAEPSPVEPVPLPAVQAEPVKK